MSGWKLGKKLKESPLLGSSSSHSSSNASPAAISRSTTPTPGNPGSSSSSAAATAAAATNASAYGKGGEGGSTISSGSAGPSPAGHAPPTSRNGLLKITVNAGRDLSLPAGVALPQAITQALKSHSSSLSSSLSASLSAASLNHNAQRKAPSSNRDSLQRKQCWWLPYVVLEFDKNEVLIESLGAMRAGEGGWKEPVWRYSATFDVSRASEISVGMYLRSSPPSSSEETGMGNSDIFLGGIKVLPDFTDKPHSDEWHQVTGGSGEVNVQIQYKAAQNVPLTIDAFELLKVVGKGSFGKVMQVRKRDTMRIYALKTIRKAHIVSRSEVTHTLAERTVLAQVNNPFIVPLKFSFQSKEKLYLVLAFVNGGELFHHLQREGKFNELRSRFYAAELLCALECLHGFNVVYRDLKPENILLDYTGHIALCDFGLCKLNMSETETTNTFCGTPEYLAPELLSGHGYTKSVDWWTLGVLLYEMLTGLPPFYDENTNEMYRKILQDPLRFPEEVHSDARSLLVGLLNRDPAQRLGVNGASEIRNHPFFARHIDWKKLMGKKIQPPFKPAVASAIDTSNFDDEFTSELPMDSVVDDSHLSETVQAQFHGFSWSVSNLSESQ